MDIRRTRRDVVCGAAGIGTALTAGCLDESDVSRSANGEEGDGVGPSNSDNGDDAGPSNSDDDALAEPSLAREWIGAGSGRHDFSTLQFGYHDIAAIESVSNALPDAVETDLREQAYAASRRILNIEEILGRDTIDEVFSFGNGSRRFGSAPTAGCGVFAGSFDAESIRTEFEAESSGDEDHRTVAGFDVYPDRHATLAIGPETAVVPNEGMSTAEFESLLEHVRSADSKRDADTAAFERFMDRLGSGTYVTGELTDEPIREAGENGNLIGYGEAVTVGDQTTTARIVGLFDATEGELTAEIDPEAEAARREERYDDVSAEIDGSALVITASVETNRFALR